MTFRAWSLYWAARSARLFLMLWLVGVLVVLASGPVVYELAFIGGRLPRYTPVWEAVPTAVGALGAGTLVPHMRSWEVSGRLGLRARAAAAALIALVLPGLIPWIAHRLALPSQTRWWDIVWNVVLLTSIALVATAIGGKVVGPLLGLGLYVATVVVQHARPDLARWVPVSGSPGNLDAHMVPAVVASSVAVLIWAWTLGCSRWAAQMWRNDAS